MPVKQRISYIPKDRAIALIHQQEFAEEAQGTALFADILGFSTLAEMLRKQLGNRLGAEVLIQHLNQAFDVLIGVIHQYGGCVVSFSGDAITCWFDAQRHQGLAASACAALMSAHQMHLNLQKMAAIHLPDGQIVQLNMKIALASGTVQRWVLGKATIQLIDTVLGDPINHLATAESLAQSGETLADDTATQLLKDDAHIREMRYSDTNEAYALLEVKQVYTKSMSWEHVSDADLDRRILREWLLPDVNAHFDANIYDLTELRTVVALFLKFELVGESDFSIEQRIRAFVRWTQEIIHQYVGNLLQITFGDKGSYLYAAFGAPISHENNASSALNAALYLREVPKEMGIVVQIGVSTGIMRAGSYGGSERYTYGVQGDEVNIASRLMMEGKSGDILVSALVMKQVQDSFTFSEPVLILVKGQSEPIQALHLLSKVYHSQSTLLMPVVTKSKIVGRGEVWIQLHRALKKSVTGRAKGLIYLCSDAGMGKTYLTAGVRQVIENDFDVMWVSIPCDTVLNISLSPFKFLLFRLFEQEQAVFDREYQALYDFVSHENSLPEIKRQNLLQALADNRLLLNLWSLPNTSIVAAADEDPDDIEELSDAILCLLRAYSLRQGIVLNIQESQALDPDSEKLIQKLLQQQNVYTLTLFLSSRFGEDGQLKKIADVPDDVEEHVIILGPLLEEESEQLLQELLSGVASDKLKKHILKQTQGNPLYIRVLVKHLIDRDYIYLKDGLWEFTEEHDRNDLPFGLQTQITAHIDRLGPKLKSLIQAAAVLGRNFDVRVLGALLNMPDILDDVSECEEMGIWLRVDETYYSFTSNLFRDVAYNMLGRERQIELHEAAKQVIPQIFSNTKTVKDMIKSHKKKVKQLRKQG